MHSIASVPGILNMVCTGSASHGAVLCHAAVQDYRVNNGCWAGCCVAKLVFGRLSTKSFFLKVFSTYDGLIWILTLS